MLRSEEMLLLAREKTEQYYAKILDLSERTNKLKDKTAKIKKMMAEVEKETAIIEKESKALSMNHKAEMEILHRNYHVAKAMEKSECVKLQTEFDIRFPKSTLDYFTASEITNEFCIQDFQFMLSMKCFEVCGCDGNVKLYTPCWR